jgi:hypothetical protein
MVVPGAPRYTDKEVEVTPALNILQASRKKTVASEVERELKAEPVKERGMASMKRNEALEATLGLKTGVKTTCILL